MPKFRKKPVVIEAEQFDPDKKPWPDGVIDTWLSDEDGCPQQVLPRIKTLEGEMIVSPGDWVITGIKGEKYPCKADIFEATYEPIEEPAASSG